MRIPVYQSQMAPAAGQTAIRGDVAAAGAAMGQVARIAGDLTDAAGRYGHALLQEDARQQAQSARIEAAKLGTEADIYWSRRLREVQNAAPEDAVGLSDQIQKEYADDMQARLHGVSDLTREVLAPKLDALRGSVLTRADSYQAAAQEGRQLRDLQQVINLNANHARSDWGALHPGLDTVRDAITASSLPAAVRESLWQKSRTAVIQSAFAGLNETDPEKAGQYLAGGDWDGLLSADVKSALVNDNHVALRRREAEARQQAHLAEMDRRTRRAELKADARYALQVMGDGVAYAGFDDLVKRAAGLDPETATTLRLAQSNQAWASGLLKMDPAGIDQALTDAKADAAAAKDPVVAASLASRISVAEHAYGRVTEAVKRDPLGWAETQGIVPKTDLLAAIVTAAGIEDDDARSQQMRQVVQSRLAAVAAARERYGVEVPVYRPTEAAAIVRAYERAETPEAKMGLLSAALLPLPDDQARRAVAQLEKEKIPAGALYAMDIAKSAPARMPVARRVLAELATEPAKNLTDADTKTAKAGAVKAYDEGIGDVLAESYALTGNVGYQARRQADLETLTRITQTRSVGGQADAADSAYADLFGHQQALSEDGLVKAIVPAAVDRQRLLDGFTWLRNHQVEDLLRAERPDDPKMAASWEQQTLAAIQRGGVFVSAGNGFVLIRPGSGKPVAGTDGKPKVWTLEDVTKAGEAAHAAGQQHGTRVHPLGFMPAPDVIRRGQ